MKTAFEVDEDLKGDLKLFRYIRLEAFMSFMETRQFQLTNINAWDDKWEVILAKLPILGDNGEIITPIESFYQHIYGQCWSSAPESDAMWRVYSVARTGIQIATSVDKFKLIGGMQRCRLGKVYYFQSVSDLLQKAKPYKSPFDDALYKRSAFSYEQEVRFLTHGSFLEGADPEQIHIGLPVDPFAFIEGVTIDPQADGWYVDTIRRYCQRIGLAAIPIQSTLYEPNPHLKLGLARKFTVVRKNKEA